MKYIAAIDQGTTSSRCILFNKSGEIVSSHSKEHEQIYTQPGWCEHDPEVLMRNVSEVVTAAIENANASLSDIEAVGITNQRETTVLWDKHTGKPVYNAIVWHDARTSSIVSELKAKEEMVRSKTGLPVATYFSATKAMWIMRNVEGVAEKCRNGDVLFGTIDSWLIYNLTEKIHVTDVTNASRTLLMDLGTQTWDDELLNLTGILPSMLPTIKSSSEVYGVAKEGSCLAGVRIAGNLGDQQAALFGQACFSPGEAKNTYGTGCFLMMNTGDKMVPSTSGLLTTAGYKIGDEPMVYALEGSIAIAGALIQWLRDNLGIIQDAKEVETLAEKVKDNGGVYLVPAFGGLLAPHWRDDARGVIVGMTSYCNRNHIARAALEAVAFQAVEVVKAMEKDTNTPLTTLKVDGGMTKNKLLMQFQADMLDTQVVRPIISETTALGAAYAAGLAVQFWQNTDELKGQWKDDVTWNASMEASTRSKHMKQWSKAVEKTLNWEEQ